MAFAFHNNILLFINAIKFLSQFSSVGIQCAERHTIISPLELFIPKLIALPGKNLFIFNILFLYFCNFQCSVSRFISTIIIS